MATFTAQVLADVSSPGEPELLYAEVGSCLMEKLCIPLKLSGSQLVELGAATTLQPLEGGGCPLSNLLRSVEELPKTCFELKKGLHGIDGTVVNNTAVLRRGVLHRSFCVNTPAVYKRTDVIGFGDCVLHCKYCDNALIGRSLKAQHTHNGCQVSGQTMDCMVQNNWCTLKAMPAKVETQTSPVQQLLKSNQSFILTEELCVLPASTVRSIEIISSSASGADIKLSDMRGFTLPFTDEMAARFVRSVSSGSPHVLTDVFGAALAAAAAAQPEAPKEDTASHSSFEEL